MSHKSIIPGVNRISRLLSYIFYFHGFLWSWNLFLFLTSLPLSLSSFLNIHSFPIIPLFHSIFQPCLPWYAFQLCSAPSGCYTWNFVSIYLPQEEERLEFLWTLLTQPWGSNPLGEGGVPVGSELLCPAVPQHLDPPWKCSPMHIQHIHWLLQCHTETQHKTSLCAYSFGKKHISAVPVTV